MFYIIVKKRPGFKKLTAFRWNSANFSYLLKLIISHINYLLLFARGLSCVPSSLKVQASKGRCGGANKVVGRPRRFGARLRTDGHPRARTGGAMAAAVGFEAAGRAALWGYTLQSKQRDQPRFNKILIHN